MQSQPLRAWKLGLATSLGAQVLSLEYNMDAYMTTFFGGEARDLCWEFSRAESSTELSAQVPRTLLHKSIKIRLHEYNRPYFNGFLGLKSRDFASTLGLASMSEDLGLGTPCERGPWTSQHTLSPIPFKQVYFSVSVLRSHPTDTPYSNLGVQSR